MHNHRHLQWKDNQAVCVICGEVYGKRYFPQLTGFFSPSDYEKYNVLRYKEAYAVNSTFTVSRPEILGLEDDKNGFLRSAT